MAITVTTAHNAGKSASAPVYVDVLNVVLDNSYPTGGEVLGLQARIGAGKTIASVQCHGIVTASGMPSAQRFEYDYTNDKIVGLVAAGTEVTNATDLSTVTVKVTVISY